MKGFKVQGSKLKIENFIFSLLAYGETEGGSCLYLKIVESCLRFKKFKVQNSKLVCGLDFGI